MLLSLLLYASCISLVVSKSVSELNERHIIVLNDDATQNDIHKVMEMVEVHEGRDREAMEMDHISFLLPIVFANISKETAYKISQLEEVKYIKVDQLMYIEPITVDSNSSKWLENGLSNNNLGGSTDRYNLDIMNKPTGGCRNNQYNPPNDGTGVDIYIFDTGINYDHDDFKTMNGNQTRAHYGGQDFVTPSTEGRDCNGHGSHCAGIAGGLLSGVAKNASLYSIRVIRCDGSGSVSGIITALNYVGTKHKQNKLESGFIASIVSMSAKICINSPFNAVVNSLVGEGVIVVTSSGNNGEDACHYSPGSAGDNINVGAHIEPTKTGDTCKNPIKAFSNWGTCVDIIAPGRSIMSVDYDDNEGFITMSGTSMATPHVAGAAAILMVCDNSLTPAEVKAKLIAGEANDIDRTGVSDSIRQQSTSERLYVPSQCPAVENTHGIIGGHPK